MCTKVPYSSPRQTINSPHHISNMVTLPGTSIRVVILHQRDGLPELVPQKAIIRFILESHILKLKRRAMKSLGQLTLVSVDYDIELGQVYLTQEG